MFGRCEQESDGDSSASADHAVRHRCHNASLSVPDILKHVLCLLKERIKQDDQVGIAFFRSRCFGRHDVNVMLLM